MLQDYIFHPYWFFSIITSFALFTASTIAYHGKRKELKQLQSIVLIISLCMPCITAIFMINTSKNDALIDDFMKRLFLFQISYDYLTMILFIMPAMILLATYISTFSAIRKTHLNSARNWALLRGGRPSA